MTQFGRQVGEFTQPRQMIRTVKNPMDKATIVSIFPKPLIDVKETIEPGRFHVPAGSYKNPATLVVGPSSWWKDFQEDQPLTEIPVSAVAVANSVISDYCRALLGVDMEGAKPGFFFVLGEVTSAEVVVKYKINLAEAKVKQDNWYRILVRMADSLWAKSNHNPLVIWDEMRLAAEELGEERPWIRDYLNKSMIKCWACGNLRDPEYPICSSCKNVDMSHPKAAEIKIASVG